MIPRLDPPLQHPCPAPRILRRVRQHLGKSPLAYMVRARTCNKDAARPEQAHGPVVDLLISAQGAFQTFLVFGESRRVEDDRVVPHSFFMALAEEIEGIRL